MTIQRIKEELLVTLVIDNRQDVHEASRIEEIIENVVKSVLEYEDVEDRCQVSVTLVNNKEIREINNTYRKIDNPTDVLSFPMVEYDEDTLKTGKTFIPDKLSNMDMDTGELVLGDIVISLERAYEQSTEYGHSFEREVAYLTVHGMLHLLGYDHEEEEKKIIMRKKEENILDKLNIHR